ncbi:MAG: polyprenyl synthetase family protein [Clostridia bacterium]|nr:polyprenyl synthetase family protein [Clostridia bacterium]
MSNNVSYNEEYIKLINKALTEYIPKTELYDSRLVESVEYSLLNGGKRIRPLLTLEFCKACNGDINLALPFACAVEMIHTSSLIHDDLPCMDDDDMRRGKPSNHIEFGQATAVLAGDTLLNYAYEIMLDSKAAKETKTQNRAIKCAYELAKSSGVYGMMGGQAIDLYYEDKKATEDIVLKMYEKKTGAIIRAACKMGCMISSDDENKVMAADEYAKAIGLSFQIVDDILDLTSDNETLGKPVKSDISKNKMTYVSINGIDRSRKKVRELTEKALKALDVFDGDTKFLKELALYLENRKN